jgi:uncharacterized membrane protein
MGSGVLLAALVVLWFVVLVPMVVTRGETGPAEAGVAPGRTLKRRRSVDPVVHAETERVAVDRDRLRATGELKVDVHRLRRRVLGGLVALAGLVLAGAVVVAPVLWIGQVVLDLAVVGYVLVLRKAARRERLAARRAARAAAREALWAERTAPPAARPARAEEPMPGVRRVTPAPRPAAAEERVHETVTHDLPHPSVPLAPVHPLRPGRTVAAAVPAPAGWQSSSVVGLDDDDIGFADIDVYSPRVANG